MSKRVGGEISMVVWGKAPLNCRNAAFCETLLQSGASNPLLTVRGHLVPIRKAVMEFRNADFVFTDGFAMVDHRPF